MKIWKKPGLFIKGSFNNYVDKMRGRGSKNVFFVHAQGIKTVHAEGVGQKWQNCVHVVVECPLRSSKTNPSHYKWENNQIN